MNDYYYYTLIIPFITKEDRAICTKRDSYLIGCKNKRKQCVNAFIYIHQGTPCWRYCICRYFTENEIVVIYNDIKLESNM